MFQEYNDCSDRSAKYCEYSIYIYLGYNDLSGQEDSRHNFISGQRIYSEGYDSCKSYIESRCDGRVNLTHNDNNYCCYFTCAL